jgi:hypothetical protein
LLYATNEPPTRRRQRAAQDRMPPRTIRFNLLLTINYNLRHLLAVYEEIDTKEYNAIEDEDD